MSDDDIHHIRSLLRSSNADTKPKSLAKCSNLSFGTFPIESTYSLLTSSPGRSGWDEMTGSPLHMNRISYFLSKVDSDNGHNLYQLEYFFPSHRLTSSTKARIWGLRPLGSRRISRILASFRELNRLITVGLEGMSFSSINLFGASIGCRKRWSSSGTAYCDRVTSITSFFRRL